MAVCLVHGPTLYSKTLAVTPSFGREPTQDVYSSYKQPLALFIHWWKGNHTNSNSIFIAPHTWIKFLISAMRVAVNQPQSFTVQYIEHYTRQGSEFSDFKRRDLSSTRSMLLRTVDCGSLLFFPENRIFSLCKPRSWRFLRSTAPQVPPIAISQSPYH